MDCEAIRGIAETLDLSEHRGRRLYLVLSDARTTFDLWQLTSSQPKHTAVARRLSEIRGSIMRIARDGKDPQFAEVRAILAQEGERWAAMQKSEDLLALGFEPMSLGGGQLYGATDVVERWFQVAAVMNELVRRAQKTMDVETKPLQGQGEPGAKEWLIGKRLPEIYEAFSGKKFGKSKQGDKLTNTGGLAFVAHNHRAIGLGPIALETIVSHRRNFGRRS